MKLVKSLLLGSAAGFVAIAGASAADLPSRKAAPAEYVKVCSVYGAGFFYIPGTDVCLKVGGMARFEYSYAQPRDSSTSGSGFRSIGRVELDARNPTAYGTLRAFVRVDFQQRSGYFRSGSSFRWGQGYEGTGSLDSGVSGGGAKLQNVIWIDKAFVQWGGLIAGRAASLFDFNKSPELIGVLAASSIGSTNLIGYIATFGSGFYASVSAEDPLWRRQALSSAAIPGGTTQFYGGSRLPDLVANIGVEQSWGAAQLSAALHQINTNNNTTPLSSTKYGWAVQGGVQINLPMLAPGDYLWLNAAYAEGAMSYVYSGHCYGGCALNNIQFSSKAVGYWAPDAFVDPTTGAIQKITEKEKLGLGTPPVKIGTAFYDHGRCLPWSMQTPCIVCEEFCPTSPKAIWVEEVEAPMREPRPGPNGEQPAMKTVKLQRPHVDPSLCIGCGACEKVCPVQDQPAVYITSVGETRSKTNVILLENSNYNQKS